MNDANLNNHFEALIRELEKLNATMKEIRDRLPESASYTLMEK